MNIELDKEGLKILVRGCNPNYSAMDHPLVKKAGHFYSDQYGQTNWYKLEDLTENELHEVYLICRKSWVK